MVPPGRDTTARAVRRQRLLHGMRERLRTARGRLNRVRLMRRIALSTLAMGAAATAAVIVAGRTRTVDGPELAHRTGAEMGVGVGVVKGSVVLYRQGQGHDRGLAAGEDIVVGKEDSLETHEQGGAQLMLSDIASLTMAPGTRVAEIAAPAGHVERITLSRGRAHLWVSKLRGGRRFHVITPDVDIQVRGTEFDVELGTGPKPKTCVRVQEGLVMVTAGTSRELLEAGRSWGCEVAEQPRAATFTTAELPRALPSRAPHRSQSASDLRIQNALFQRGLRAERAGQYGAAAQVYRRLLEVYPDGPLTGQAEANLAAMPTSR
jgi:hypothetical protein